MCELFTVINVKEFYRQRMIYGSRLPENCYYICKYSIGEFDGVNFFTNYYTKSYEFLKVQVCMDNIVGEEWLQSPTIVEEAKFFLSIDYKFKHK